MPYIWAWILQSKIESILDADGILAGWIFYDYSQLPFSFGYRDAQPRNVLWENFENFVASFVSSSRGCFRTGEMSN